MVLEIVICQLLPCVHCDMTCFTLEKSSTVIPVLVLESPFIGMMFGLSSTVFIKLNFFLRHLDPLMKNDELIN